jgi:protocatechuate 3,4-dioxygenase, beta subunit
MPLILTPEIGRRRFIAGGITAALASAGGLILPSLGRAEQRVLTPSQTEGPFYPTQFPSDTDNDLVVVRGSAARAQGVVTHIMGRVLTADGRPIAGAQVEIWRCDAHGCYLHPASDGRQPRDAGFQGFGRALTGPDGAYAFRTIRPVPYAGRTPHIHFAVASAASRLVTQMYVAGEPLNARDGVYAAIRDRRQREAVTVRLDAASGIEAGALAGQFDIVLRA